MSAIRLACVASVSVWFRSKERLRFWPREKWNESQKMKEGGGEGGRKVSFPPHLLPDLFLATLFARSVTLVPRSLLVNRTETLAMQATIRPQKFHSVDVHLFGIWSTSADWSTHETFLATKCEDRRLYSLAMICEGEFQIYSRPIRVNCNAYVWTGENDSKTIRYVWTRFFLETTSGKNSLMQLKKRDICKRAWDFIIQKDVKRLLYIMEKRCLKANHSLSVLKFVILFTIPWEEFNITCKHFEIFLYDSRPILILFIYFFCLPYLLAYVKQFCMRILKLTGWRLHRNRFVWVIFGSMYVK